MQSGRIKYFNEVRGFGFIEHGGRGEDIFVHILEVADGQLLERVRLSNSISARMPDPAGRGL
jgi:cold shock CspA family protein